MMSDYPDNLILTRDELEQWERERLEETPKAPGWLPFQVYDMVQTGYPRPDHGEMIWQTDSGTDAQSRLLPPPGMWCKVEDVRPIVEALIVQMDATRYDYAWCKTDCAETIAEIEARYPFLVTEPRSVDARIHALRELADKMSAVALANARGDKTDV